jgi:glycosyltransferase involved in cell wall biosynthesis
VLLKDGAAIFEIYSLIKKFSPEIVHLNSSKAGTLGAISAKLAGVKRVIYTVHGFVFLEPLTPGKKTFYIWAERISSMCKDQIICVSEYDREQGLRYRIAPEKKFVTIHNGIEAGPGHFMDRAAARLWLSQKLGQPLNDRMVLGTIANFYATKGLGYFISAAALIHKKYPEIQFVIIGDGIERPALEKHIEQYGLKDAMYLPGQIPDAPRYLKGFDMYINSSVKEGFPYSILEAMAAGLPIVATRVGGVAEMLLEHCGVLVEPRQTEALASAIMKIIGFKQLLLDLGKNAEQLVAREFTLTRMLEKTLTVYNLD